MPNKSASQSSFFQKIVGLFKKKAPSKQVTERHRAQEVSRPPQRKSSSLPSSKPEQKTRIPGDQQPILEDQTLEMDSHKLMEDMAAQSSLNSKVQADETMTFSTADLIADMQEKKKEKSSARMKRRPFKISLEPEPKTSSRDEDVLQDDLLDRAITELNLSDEAVKISTYTEKKFPVLSSFIANLLQWIEQNLGLGLLGPSLRQIYAADAEFELEPDDFIIRFLQGIQINNLSPLIKIICLRVPHHLDPDLAQKITDAVTSYEQKIQMDRLVEIFPWQKKRAAIRHILEHIPKKHKNEVFNQLQKTTREKTKEITIKKWLAVISKQDFYSTATYTTLKEELELLHDEFRKSTADTRLLQINLKEMIAQAEQEKSVQKLNDLVVERLNDLPDRKTKLTENLYFLLEMLANDRLIGLQQELARKEEIDVFYVLQQIILDKTDDSALHAPALADMCSWREELRIKEALKRMYFISRAYKHDLLSRSLLILGCLTENDEGNYKKKVKKITELYGFDLIQYLLNHPFNPNSTKALTPNGKKYTLQFEQKKLAGSLREEMILYREGSILAQLIVQLPKDRKKQKQPIDFEGTPAHLQRCAYGLETMINFYHSHDEIMGALNKSQRSILDQQGLQSLKEMIENNQAHFLTLDPAQFGLNAYQWQEYYSMGYIVGKLIDDIFMPLGKYVQKVLNI